MCISDVATSGSVPCVSCQSTKKSVSTFLAACISPGQTMAETGKFQDGDQTETRYWENAVVMKETRVSVTGRSGRDK